MLRRLVRHKAIPFLLCLLLLLTLTGCWDRTDPEKVAWITAIGVDVGPNNDYLFTFQIPKPGKSGGPSTTQGAQSGTGNTVFAMEAPDVITAIDAMQAFVARRPSLTHAKALVLGEDLARSEVTAVVGAATRFPEFRRNMMVMVARGMAHDFLAKVQPQLESNAVRWWELLMYTHQISGIIPNTRIHEFILEKESVGVGALAVLVSPREDVAQGRETLPTGQSSGALPPTAGSSEAGDFRRLGELPVELGGTAIFKGGTWVGSLTADETRLMMMMRGEFRRASMGFVDPNDPTKRIIFRLGPRSAPKLTVERQGTKVTAHFRVFIDGDMMSVQSRNDYTRPALREELESSVEQELERRMGPILTKTLNQWAVDVFRIDDQLKATVRTWDDWLALDWGKTVTQTRWTVDVSFRMRRFGLQTQPSQPKE